MDFMKEYEKWLSSTALSAEEHAELEAIRNDPKEIESLTARVQSIQSAEDLISRQAEKIKELLLNTPGKNQDNPPAPGDEPPFVPKTFAELADEIMKGK